MQATKQEIIEKLHRELLGWEGFKPPQPGESDHFGLGTLNKLNHLSKNIQLV